MLLGISISDTLVVKAENGGDKLVWETKLDRGYFTQDLFSLLRAIGRSKSEFSLVQRTRSGSDAWLC